jgi:hypothetical protein
MNPIYYGWWIVLASFITAFYVAGTIFYGFTAFIERDFPVSLSSLKFFLVSLVMGFSHLVGSISFRFD